MTIGLPEPLKVDFAGRRTRLFKLAFVTGICTLLTLGLYRFWAKTRLRRWYWSALRPGGQPLEYVGDGAEKIAGFFLAVSVLAFWLGVVNLILMFATLALFSAFNVAYLISFVAILPLVFYARYRARAYVMARTRWRGIRFGMAPGAGGYAWRGLWNWFLAIATFGILWPRATFRLEKYKIDRTYFGTQLMHQGGDWHMLWPAFGHLFAALILSIGALAVSVFEIPSFAWSFVGLGPWLIYGLVHYRVKTKQLLVSTRTIGGMQMQLEPDVWTIGRIAIFGSLAALIALQVPLMVIGAAAYYLEQRQVFDLTEIDFADPTIIAASIAVIVGYFLFFLLFSTLRHCFVTMPIWRHYASRFALRDPGKLSAIAQRPRAASGQAEGFAEALDLGAAI